MQLHEGLKSEDLKDLVRPVFEVDSYKSKMGDDENVVVLAFEVTGHQAALDFADFIEKGYNFVLDADISTGEDEHGNYKVFVEIERGRKIARQISEMMYGLSELTGCEDWKFRYYKDYQSKPLQEISNIPSSADDYKARMEGIFESEMRFFFRKTPLDYLFVENEVMNFKRPFTNPVKMKLIQHGTRTDILNNLAGTIRVDESSMSETMWLTKYFGNYNITKYGDDFVFENENTVVVLKLLK
jgi:hypothetical protein